jgi:hypothetical protein
MEKEIKSKPVFFSIILPDLQKIAVKHGYNLIPHGSFNRDFDIVCIAWSNKYSKNEDVLKEIAEFLGVRSSVDNQGKWFNHSVLPGGRDAYVIYCNYGFDSLGNHNDDQWYLDISFTPKRKTK